MKVLMTGATGFIGRGLCLRLNEKGHTLTALSRDAASAKLRLPSLDAAFTWDPLSSPPPAEAFEGVDGVIHLAGEVVAGLWTPGKKVAIRSSRILGTRHLIDGIEGSGSKSKVLISASAIGYYGDRGEETLSEDSGPGSDFLPETCQEWEREAVRAETLGLRVVRLRSGLVMGLGGGAFPVLFPLFRMGLGGPLGSGRQWWPWIHLDDVVGLIIFALENELSGSLNATAPQPVRQKEFARILGRVLRRPTFFPAPAFALKILLGGFSAELLDSRRVLPVKAEAWEYKFQFSELEVALRNILGSHG